VSLPERGVTLSFFLEKTSENAKIVPMHLVSQSPQDTAKIARTIAQRLLNLMPLQTQALVVALRGELGAGKTTLTQGLAAALGIKEQPKSPTFNLLKTYSIPNTTYRLWHIDCYRLSGRGELAALDLHTAFADSHNLIVIEWPENIGDGLPRNHFEVHMTHEGSDKRGITFSDA
jgi:tRNA threonylcarbamoyladenosine biosynthesis protein TsaE